MKELLKKRERWLLCWQRFLLIKNVLIYQEAKFFRLSSFPALWAQYTWGQKMKANKDIDRVVLGLFLLYNSVHCSSEMQWRLAVVERHRPVDFFALVPAARRRVVIGEIG